MRLTTRLLLSTVLLAATSASASAQEKYRQPPADVVAIVDAPPLPAFVLSPAKDRAILVQREGLPRLLDLAQPMVGLAGVRVNPKTNGLHETTGAIRQYTILRLPSGEPRAMPAENAGRLSAPVWAPDGQAFAYTITQEDGVRVMIADKDGAPAGGAVPDRLNAAAGTAFRWMSDGKRLLCRTLPKDRGEPPAAPLVPEGPVVQEAAGKKAKVWTYQDLLKNPRDDALFEYTFRSQMAVLDSGSRTIASLGAPGIYGDVAPSPDGRFFLVTRYKRPWSHFVPLNEFSKTIEVWNASGEVVRTVADLPVADEVPIDGVLTGPRAVEWNPAEPATLVWVEALDGGDPETKAKERDRILTLAAPFQGEPRETLRLEWRFRGIAFGEGDGLVLVSEYERQKRWMRTWIADSRGASKPRVLFDYSTQDGYKDPGQPLTKRIPGGAVLLRSGESLFFAGAGASPEGERPFLDRWDLAKVEAERLFRSDADAYESVVSPIADDASTILTRRETTTEPPNYFLRNLKDGSRSALTHAADPAPALRAVKKELVRYEREDGVKLSATLYVPPGRKEGERVPLVVWAYPLEYNDRGTAGQVRGSANRFTLPSGISHLFFLLRGYAVLDGAAMPVVGDYKTVNDTYVQQIVMSAKAAIAKVADMGIADPERVGVGGHSYGAFMTANLLAHSDLFRAGIARSGAYNRTLTPFGFQSERRTFWEATETYVRMSPFTYADKINEPLLLLHGEKDSNTGTFPIQSERLFHAIQGHGGTVRFVLLPFEDHGYSARESVLDVLAEMFDWFDKYVKNAPPRKPGQGSGGH